MAQHDFSIANQGFPAFRSDLNDALESLVTNSSGATEPSTTYAHQFWVDTAANPSVLKQRNADNDAWVTIGTINQTSDTFNLAVAQGGTGSATLTSNAVILGNGTSAVQTVSPGTSGNVLTSNGTTWQSTALSGTFTNVNYTGTLTGGTGVVNLGSGQVYKDASGKVGIGTSSPACKIDVAGVVRATSTGAPASGAGLELSYGGTADTADIIAYDRTGAAFKNLELRCSNLIFNTGGGGEQARIDSSGNLKFNSGYGSAATAYGCRAWVNFNGTGTVAIRASGNVSSITDLGTGNYRVNFTTAMPDANFATTATAHDVSNTSKPRFVGSYSKATGSCSITVSYQDSLIIDAQNVEVSIFR